MNKVLIFIDWYKPAYKAGGPISSIFNMVEFLGDHIDFFIVTSNYDLDNKLSLNVKINTWVKESKANVIYLDKKNQKIKLLKSLIKHVNPDKIYLNGIFSFFFSILPCILFNNNFDIIIHPRGMLGTSALSIKKAKKLFFLKMVNFSSMYKGVFWHVSNKKELVELKKHFNISSNVNVIPNLPRSSTNIKKENKRSGLLNLVTICRVNKIKNIEFILELLKDIPLKCNYKIIGFIEDQKYYKRLNNIIEILPDNINVKFTGLLNQKEIESELSKADLFVSSSLNENYGHSIVESLSCGLPVLISNFCPWNNLDKYRAGFKLTLDKNKFKEKLLFFYKMDSVEYRKYNLGAQSYFKKYISAELHKNKYLNLLSTNKRE